MLFVLLVLLVPPGSDPLPHLLFALLWAVHPLRAEAVCWVAERKELVSVLFALVSLVFHCRSHLAASVLFAGLAMMAKPVAVTLPAVILAHDWFIRGKVRILRVVPYAVLSAVTCLLTLRAQTCAMELGDAFPLGARLMCILGSPIVYLRQTVWPFGLSLLYGNSRGPDWLLLISGGALVLAMVGLFIWWLIRRGRIPSILLFGVAWAYVGLIPMLGIVKVAGEEHSDRYTYWVGCGLVATLLLLAGEVRRPRAVAERDWADLMRLGRSVLVCIVLALSAMSVSQSGIWKDGLTLYRDIMAKNWNPQIAVQLGELAMKEGGGYEEAHGWLRECAARAKCPESYYALGRILLKAPNKYRINGVDAKPYLESELLFREVLEMRPDHAGAKELLAWIEEHRKER